MPYTATVTQNNVMLPDGNLYQSGDAVLLSDADYVQMGPVDRAAVLTDLRAVSPGVTDGNTVLSKTSNPVSGDGVDGDFCINTVAHTIFGPKASGAWPSGTSLIGPAGPTGSTGPAGSTWFQGSGVPSSGTGANGDFYLRSNGDVYRKSAGSWGSVLASLLGPAGPTGSTGSTGPSGSSILHGTGAPSGGTGANNDFYLDTASSTLWGPKASGSWPGSGVVLSGSSLQPWQFAPENYGAVGDNVTDDSTAINACIAAADAYASANGGLYEIVFKSAVYYVGNTLITGGATQGSALLPIPPHLISTTVPAAVRKITAIFSGAGYVSSGLYHWEQTVPQRAGTVLRTNYDGGGPGTPATGEASVIGGPTPHYVGQPPTSWANVKVVIRGLTIEVPANPNVCGVDLRGIAEAEVTDLTVLATQSGTGAPLIPTPAWAFGLAMPLTNNNDLVDVDNFSCEGFTYGLIGYEHLRANSLRLINSYIGLIIWNTGFPHSSFVAYASVENCFKCVELAGAVGKLDIALCDIEWGSGAIFTDACSTPGTGTINVGSNSTDGDTLNAALSTGGTAVTGTTRVRIVNRDQAPGAVTAPSVPASTTALANPFWRDAFVAVSGGTVTAITVGGVATGLTSGLVAVGTGKTIAITYSAAPSWTWTLV